MIDKVNKDIVSFLLKSGLPSQANASKEDITKIQNTKLQMSRPEGTTNIQNANQSKVPKQKAQPIKAKEKVNRNAPCPCGSGKKYKKCHGR